jgi:hypothetical protein
VTSIECCPKSAGLDFVDIHRAGWSQAFRAIARIGEVPKKTREAFLRLYVHSGDHIRQESDDLALIAGLRVLLPPYGGLARMLFRGQGMYGVRRRSYGLSWSAKRTVAEAHAHGWLVAAF